MHAHSGIIWTARRKARVEIIPLIDVIFFLLATFVLFTLSLNKIRSVPVVLPNGGLAQPPDPALVNLSVSGAGVVYWNKEQITAAEIPMKLEILKSQLAEPRILVSGDERAHFGEVVAVFDEVRRAGITKLSIETRTRATVVATGGAA